VPGIDVASYQPADLADLIKGLTPRPEHVVVRLYLPWEKPSRQHSLDQIASARWAGCSVGGICWPYPEVDPRQTVLEALTLADHAGLTLPILWMDLETYDGQPGPDADWLLKAADAGVKQGVKCGLYTAQWYIDTYVPDAARLGHLPLWAAFYNHIADLDSVPIFGGWTRNMLWGHQYNADGIDRDVFDARACNSN
jgi:hypothetical protein